MQSITAYGKVEKGRLILHSEKKFKEDLKDCQDLEIILTVKKRGRMSTPQRGYYHGIIVENIRHKLIEVGHRMDHEDCHTFLKLKFNPIHIADEQGEVIATFPGSTTEMNVTEMADYMNAIIEWAAVTLDCHIPPPDKSLTINF